jgi:hypothetical protein
MSFSISSVPTSAPEHSDRQNILIGGIIGVLGFLLISLLLVVAVVSAVICVRKKKGKYTVEDRIAATNTLSIIYSNSNDIHFDMDNDLNGPNGVHCADADDYECIPYSSGKDGCVAPSPEEEMYTNIRTMENTYEELPECERKQQQAYVNTARRQNEYQKSPDVRQPLPLVYPCSVQP